MKTNQEFTPSVENMNQLDAAVLLSKQIYILGMLNNGTPEQKAMAKQELKDIDILLKQHLNTPAMEQAVRNLGFSYEELNAINDSLSDE